MSSIKKGLSAKLSKLNQRNPSPLSGRGNSPIPESKGVSIKPEKSIAISKFLKPQLPQSWKPRSKTMVLMDKKAKT